MTPVDPKLVSIPTYDPHPTNFRFKGYPNGEMEKSIMDLKSERKPEPKRGDFVIHGSLHQNDPGKAPPGQPSGFYGGMHASDITYMDKKLKQKTLAAMVTDDDRAHQKEVMQRRQEMKAVTTEYQAAKVQKSQEFQEQKRRDLEQLQAYDPWGKPGGGAPSGKTVLTELAHIHDRQVTESFGDKKPYADQVFGHQGGGAPLLADNGKLKTKLTVDTQVMLPNFARSNPNFDRETTRAKTVIPVLAKELRSIADEQRAIKEEQRLRDSTVPPEVLAHNPFGKPGGGARNPHREGQPMDPQKKAYGEELQKQISSKPEAVPDQPMSYDPWGKGFGTLPDRDDQGRVVKHPPAQIADKSKYKSFADMVGKPGGGAPLTNEKGNVKTHLPTDHLPPRDPTDVFGNVPTAPPPRLNDEEIKNIQEIRADKKKYLKSLQKGIDERKKLDQVSRQELLAPINQEEFFKMAPPVNPDGGRNPDKFTTQPPKEYRRGKSDVIALSEHRLGMRPEPPEVRRDLARAIDEFQAQKAQTDVAVAKEERVRELRHLEAANSWQGQGFGAPRRGQDGEVHGRFGLDKDMHMTEPLNAVRSQPLEQRRQYQTELDRIAAENAQLRVARRQLSASERQKTDIGVAFQAKPGGGAPLRGQNNEKVTKTGLMRDPTDAYKLNTSKF